MDPIACLNQCISASLDGDRETARELLQAYRDWVDMGGFRAPADLVAEAVSWMKYGPIPGPIPGPSED